MAITVEENRERVRKWKAANRERALAKNRELRQRRAQFLTMVKTTAGCIDCGTSDGRLDFDHREGTEKLFNVGEGQRSIKTLVKEIEKCNVRCVSCHAKRHWRETRRG